MRFGLVISSQHAPGDDLSRRFREHLEQVALAKAVGFSSVSASQHFVSAPFQYLQPVPLLARICDVAEGLGISLGVIVLPLHHPLEVAEAVATLDVISGGRTSLGVALGYRDEENEAFGQDPRRRVSRFEESLEIIELLWSGEPVTFSGRHFQMKDVRISCRPVRRPRPPIGIGASAEKGIRRAARLGDAWICASHATIDTVEKQIEYYQRCRKEFGKDPLPSVPLGRECYVAPTCAEALSEGVRAIAGKYRSYREWGQDDAMPGDETFALGEDELAKDRFIIGDPAAVRDEVARYRDRLGLASMSFRVQWPGMDNARVLRSIRLLGEQVLPHV